MSESNNSAVADATDNPAQWSPTRPADKYTDDEIRGLDLFRQLRSFLSTLPEDVVISSSREMIEKLWKTKQSQVLADPIKALFAAAVEKGIELPEAITIMRDGSYQAAKMTGDRFKLADYAKLIGKGPFTHEVKQARTASKNGKYLLYIEEPRPGSNKPFSARLVQQNGNKSAPVIQFPPADPDNPKTTATLVEVKAMSNMLKASDLQSPLTPGVIFKLKDHLDGKVSDDTSSDDDEDEDEDEEENNTRPAKSKAHAALDDEDDED